MRITEQAGFKYGLPHPPSDCDEAHLEFSNFGNTEKNKKVREQQHGCLFPVKQIVSHQKHMFKRLVDIGDLQSGDRL